MLATRGKQKNFGSMRREFQYPLRQTFGIKQFAWTTVFQIRVAGIFGVEARDGGLKFIVHAAIFSYAQKIASGIKQKRAAGLSRRRELIE